MDSIFTGLAGGLITLIIFACILFIPILIVFIIGMCKTYQKAGKQGWEAIVPFYNTWVLVEIAGLAWWWFLVISAMEFASLLDINTLYGIASLATLVGSFVCNYNISMKLHKDVGFAILMTIFPVVMFPIIGFSSKYQFDESVSVSDMGPFAKNDTVVDNDQSKEATTSEKDKVSKSGNVSYCPQCGQKVDKDFSYCDKCGTKLK